MKLRSKPIVIGIVLLISLGVLPAGLYLSRPRDNLAGFDRIRVGWTYSQVVEVFGGEPGYSHQRPTCATWYFDGAEAFILFDDQDGTVGYKLWIGPRPPSLLDRLRTWVSDQ
jgi:hypothetical protein